jgi:18S rRNA (adenine1779-N6/adenine1780-N6)-dimethyltransferase
VLEEDDDGEEGGDGEGDGDDEGENEGEGEGGAAGRAGAGARSGPLAETRAVVERVLTETGMSDARAAKLSIDDFLRLLAAFNAAGVHFA